jgi:gamma-glutamyl-gamma-aminobutyrate hydrolase PuuD
MPIVGISYRSEGNGKGAFFDHFTLRKMTGWHTTILASQETPTTTFASYINGRAGFGDYGLPLDTSFPDTSSEFGVDCAFIFIPGFTRDSDKNQPLDHQNRLDFERQLINKAINRGQPVLSVCAGSWTLWQAYGGELIDVSEHNYGGAMPRLSKASAKVCNNKMIHRVSTEPNTLVGGVIQHETDGTENTPVNSVHWKAVKEASLDSSANMMVSAYSVQDDAIAPKSRQSKQMKPQTCPEAIETRYGVPMVGLQWHPEAFNPKDANSKPHQALFKALKTAGETYLNRRAVNEEVTSIYDSGHRFFKQHCTKVTDPCSIAKNFTIT